ncbi:unnamed protein product [Didymodactylos carnosus]|uniref:BHLH domain-containing protein n=1 Tax=Didymodactylos carnosus TaxID=1234261 RepID=A0A813WUA3_9BILA|nr:unnamed protein product [Didymodactylos carnosus]CAF0858765.1 unnamed protein product [Didymodactylos carnosus]CAF3521385.1 unnamed protein product [Didymodactylos carnosus]CAF3646427.1 unnamed protein product [Didymodactylos carnosus]
MLACDYSNTSPYSLEQSSRKLAKTCVEKKRRDRINKSLDELKELMALTDERARYQKLEKAEILEMAVNYVRNLKRVVHISMEDYENGYRQCTEEIWKLINAVPNIVPEQRERLANRCRQMWVRRTHPYARTTHQTNQLHQLPHHINESSHSMMLTTNKIHEQQKLSPIRPLELVINNNSSSIPTTLILSSSTNVSPSISSHVDSSICSTSSSSLGSCGSNHEQKIRSIWRPYA